MAEDVGTRGTTIRSNIPEEGKSQDRNKDTRAPHCRYKICTGSFRIMEEAIRKLNADWEMKNKHRIEVLAISYGDVQN